MKNILPVLIVMFIFFVSCTKTENILPRQDGEWNIDKQTTTTTTTGSSPTIETDTNAGIVTFNDDGSGKVVDGAGITETFHWDVDGDIITINYDLLGITIIYTIEESSKNTQEWEGSYSFSILGLTTEITQQLTLSSIE